jgi:hypothetical protein
MSVAPASSAAADTTPPRGAVAGVHSPVTGALELFITASDDGAGLATATALVNGAPLATLVLSQGCELGGSPPMGGCAHQVSGVPMRLDLTALAVGLHRLQVRIADAAGNEADVYDGEIRRAGPPPIYSPTVSLRFGNSGSPSPPGGDPPLRPGPADGPRCTSPWLSMMLASRPLRIRRGRPVLAADRRYRFRGRLTCRVGRSRQGAPRGTRIVVLGKSHRRVVSRTNARVKRGGRIVIALSQRTSRRLTFRYGEGRESAQVRIPVVVVRSRGRGR